MKRNSREKKVAEIVKSSDRLWHFIWSVLLETVRLREHPENLEDRTIDTLFPIVQNLKRIGYNETIRSDSGDNFVGLMHEGLSLIYQISNLDNKSLEQQKAKIKELLKGRYPDVSDEIIDKMNFSRDEISDGLNRNIDPTGTRQFHKGGPQQAAYHAIGVFHGKMGEQFMPKDTKTVESWIRKSRNSATTCWYAPLTQAQLTEVISYIWRFQEFARHQECRLNFPKPNDSKCQLRVENLLLNDKKSIVNALRPLQFYASYTGDEERDRFGITDLYIELNSLQIKKMKSASKWQVRQKGLYTLRVPKHIA